MGDWKIGKLQIADWKIADWKIGRLEDWKIGKLENCRLQIGRMENGNWKIKTNNHSHLI
jgi:hypothetical protein